MFLNLSSAAVVIGALRVNSIQGIIFKGYNLGPIDFELNIFIPVMHKKTFSSGELNI